MELYLVRHAQTELNLEKRIAGSRIDTLLTQKGIQQTKKISERLKGENFDLILSSPLTRTRQTLKIILENQVEHNLQFDEGLIERDWGSLSGEFHKNVDFENLAVDTEKIEDFEKRIISTLEKYYNQNKDSKVLVVTHSGVIRTVLNKFFPGSNLIVPNVSLTVFKFCINGNHSLMLEPCDSHLN